MRRYEYKHSNIEWLGEIPSHWDVATVRNHFSVTPSNVDKKSYDGQNEVKLCNYTDVYYNDFIDPSLDFMVATASDHEIRKFQLVEGDVLITKDSEDPFDIAVPALVKETEENLICGYHLSMLRSTRNHVLGAYLFWVLKDDAIVSQLHREACGITRWAIGSKHIRGSSFPLPPLEEQKAISEYLDRACDRIDRTISIKEKQLEKIERFYTSRVYEIVTKGLDVNDPLSKTENEWIPEIPKDWKITRLKTTLSKINSGVTPKGGSASYVAEGIPLIRSQNVNFNTLDLSDVVYIPQETHDKMSNSKVIDGDVLLNITGASLGRCSVVENVCQANVNQHVCILRPFQFITTRFLYYLLLSEVGQSQIFSSFTGSGREGLNFKAIKVFQIPLPSKGMQDKIVTVLDELSVNIEKQKALVQRQIETLKSYRKALIHECVTGKKQVYAQ